MRKIYKLSLTVLAGVMISTTLLAQNSFFSEVGQNRTVASTGQRIITPEKFRTVSLDNAAMKTFLWALPGESNFISNRSNAPVITLPMPDGSMARFRVWESSVQAPELAARFPEIKTFAGQGIDDPYATIRFDYNPYFGFSAQILSANTGRIYIDAYARGDVNNYISYYQKDARRRSPFKCSVVDNPVEETLEGRTFAGPCLGTQLRTYRLAVACTGEYSQAVAGGNAAGTHAAIVTSVNRITGVYEVELAVRLVLIANNNLIEYTNGATDPFVNTINTTLLNANQANTDAVIGTANYDIGHIFTSDDNGLAQLQAVCQSSGKARGATGAPVLIGDGFDIDYVAHEMGHQFGANHTFNSNTCASAGGSYEPGGGTTIMAYAGICAATENIQPNSDPIFHAFSFDQISTYISTGGGSGCAVLSATGNTLPVITLPLQNNNVSIPINTPFTLTGAATDANGDALTYNWEGWDVGTAGSWTSAASSTTRPLFRTRVSKTTGTRTFPDIRVIAANYPGTSAPSAMDGLRGEVLPTVARAMKFRLTVRDNRAGGGGVVSAGDGCQDAVVFTVNAVGSTPFAVTVPNGGESYTGGSTQTITWDNAGTTAAPFNVANVKITLSTDGGLTYPTTILASTPNDGSESVTIPATATTTARIRVEAIGNIFFDISNANFTITAPASGFTFDSPGPVNATCPTPATLSANLTATYTGAHTADINLTSTVAPAGPTVTLTPSTITFAGTHTTAVTITNASSLAPGTYTVTVTGTSTGATTQTRNIVFNIAAAAPTITTQPADQTVCVGTNATFTSASPTATGFQWQVSTNGGGSWSNITGATSSSYTVVAPTITQNGNQYRVIASTGCGSTTSNAATLTVVTPATITTQPANLTICDGANTSFSVVASTTFGTLTYQWQFSTNGGATWNNIPGATNATYGQTGVNVTENGYQFRVVVTSGCGSLNSNAAVLTVNAYPSISFNPQATICLSDAAITLAATPLGGTFAGTGVTGTTFTPSVAGLGPKTITYTATNAGCQSVSTRTISVLDCAERHLRLEDYPAVFVYPVPNHGDFNIRMNTDLYTKLNIRIFNAMGQQVYSTIATGIGYGSVIPVHTFNLAPGTYHVYLSNDEKGGDVSKKGVKIVITKP